MSTVHTCTSSFVHVGVKMFLGKPSYVFFISFVVGPSITSMLDLGARLLTKWKMSYGIFHSHKVVRVTYPTVLFAVLSETTWFSHERVPTFLSVNTPHWLPFDLHTVYWNTSDQPLISISIYLPFIILLTKQSAHSNRNDDELDVRPSAWLGRNETGLWSRNFWVRSFLLRQNRWQNSYRWIFCHDKHCLDRSNGLLAEASPWML